ncbi:MAG: hypothetical protein QXI19_07010 [Candidatus Caldarchaeum sp.]
MPLTEYFSASERKIEKTTCSVCRGFARFCKLTTCPYYRNILTESEVVKITSGVVYGPSPPTVIIGEKGYPRVRIGPAVSLADHPEPWVFEEPSKWIETSLDKLLSLRLSLFYGRTVKPVMSAAKQEKMLEDLQDSAASTKPVDVEIRFEGKPITMPGFSVRNAPHGPSARIEMLKLVGNVSVPRKVDSMINDLDLPAAEAVKTLYLDGFNEYYLTRVFSTGLLGRKAERRLVPTEWSITAVDDIISKKLFEEVRRNMVIHEFRLHTHQAVENAAHIILTPTPWMYELLEGWVKHPDSQPYSDHEILTLRKTYAENTGGAFYAVRLSLLRHLKTRRELAGAIVFFEILPRWIPLGVWRFREIVRKALEKPFEKHQSLNDALESVSKMLRIPLYKYVSQSRLISFLRKQQTLAKTKLWQDRT